MSVCFYLFCSLTLSDTSICFLLNNIPLYGHTIIHIFGCWWILGLFSIFGHYKQRCICAHVSWCTCALAPLDCSGRQRVARGPLVAREVRRVGDLWFKEIFGAAAANWSPATSTVIGNCFLTWQHQLL